MSEQKPKTITLRRLEPGDDFQDSDLIGPARSVGKADGSLKRYREVSPIPEGFEVCDLEGATKVLLGETWCEVEDESLVIDGILIHKEVFSTVGILAIRPIPEPEPRSGVTVVKGHPHKYPGDTTWADLPADIPEGTRIRWEEVVKDGGE